MMTLNFIGINIISQCTHIDEFKFNQHTINNLGNYSIFHINCGSLNAKFDSINTYLASLNTKFDVLCFTESWIHKNSAGFIINNYNCFHFPTSEGRCGGISTYGNRKLSVSKVDINFDAVNFEFECIKSDLFSQKLYVLVIYRPPSTNINDLLEEF